MLQECLGLPRAVLVLYKGGTYPRLSESAFDSGLSHKNEYSFGRANEIRTGGLQAEFCADVMNPIESHRIPLNPIDSHH